MADIFISYASDDRLRVKPLAIALEGQGWSVWWDRKIPPGKKFSEVIEEEVSSARCVIVLWSIASVKSDFVQTEAAVGAEKRILIPATIDEVRIPFEFRRIHAANLTDWNGESNHEGFLQLIGALINLLGSPIPVPTSETYKPAPSEPIAIEIPTLALSQKPALQQKITNSIGMDFVRIPAGLFTMGSSQGGDNEKLPHDVRIPQPFYLQTTAVTQEHWVKVMGDTASHFKSCGTDCPVEQVSWRDAKRFIEKLNQLEKTKAYRLPSEAEWEYACRAGTMTEYFFGNDASLLDEYAWYVNNSKRTTRRVATKKANSWGLYDMLGNVWEWVEDDYHGSYKGAPVDGQAWVDYPRGSGRVVRGGGWDDVAQYCRSAMRSNDFPGYRSAEVGFRLSKFFTLDP